MSANAYASLASQWVWIRSCAGRAVAAVHWHSAYARGRESDSAFRRGKEGAGTRARICSAARPGSRSGRRVACGRRGRLAGRLRAACCVACLREMSRQRARGGMWPRVRRTCGIYMPGPCFLGVQANTSRALEISQDATQRDLDLFACCPLFPPCC